MTIAFSCPHCGWKTDISAEYAGQTGPCVSCGQLVTIPAAQTSRPSLVRRWSASQIVLGVLALIVVGSALMLGSRAAWIKFHAAIRDARAERMTSVCKTRLQRIVAAMHSYEQLHGSLPPAYTVDSNGAPLHSWRTLLLPHLDSEGQAIYRQLRLEEPWNSPWNSQFANLIPKEYRCDSDSPVGAGDTSYCVITDPRYAFDGPRTTTTSAIADGLGNTLLVVEVHKSNIPWMQPADISASEFRAGINSKTPHACSSSHPGAIAFGGWGDGSVATLSEGTTSEDLDAMGTIAGHEVKVE